MELSPVVSFCFVTGKTNFQTSSAIENDIYTLEFPLSLEVPGRFFITKLSE